MERRSMAPHQQSIDFPACLDFGCHQNEGTTLVDNHCAAQQQHFMMAKHQSSSSIKQEMPSPNRQQQAQSNANNAFLPSIGNIGCCDTLSIDQLSAIHSSSDFFPPAALHQLLLQPENGTSAVNTATAAYFCAVAPSSFSSAPADPQPSSIGQIAQKSDKTTGIGSQNGGNNSNKDRKRPYPCTQCASKFGSKMELEEHQNSHTGQKPFQCDVCQSRFNRRSTLWNHKRIHSDAKPFVCTVCHMQFKWKNSLKCHKEMHLRKNELTHGALMPDADSHALTYATAAKKKMGELTGADPSTITLLPAANASSHLLTCAGTPRKRALPKLSSKGLKQKMKIPIGSGDGQSKQQSTAGNGHQKMGGNGAGTTMIKGNGSKGKMKELAGNWGGGKGNDIKGQISSDSNGRNGGITATATAMATELDLFRLPCDIIPPIVSSSSSTSMSSSNPINGLHIQNSSSTISQSPFLHIDPLIKPSPSSVYLDSSNAGHHQQIGPSLLINNHTGQIQMGGIPNREIDLLNCGNNGQSNAQQSSALCCNLLQDFQMGGGNGGGIQHIIEQQNANFLGFDINSLAMDPNLLVHASSVSSASAAPSAIIQQFPSCTQFVQNGQQPSSANGCTTNSTNMSSGYHQFDSTSLRFLEQGMSSEIQQRIQSQQQQVNAHHLGTNPLDFGLFSSAVDYGYPATQGHHNQQQQQSHNNHHNNQQQQQLFLAENGGGDHQFILDTTIATDQQHHHHHQQQQFTMSAALAHEQQQQYLVALGGGGDGTAEMSPQNILMKVANDGTILERQHEHSSRHHQHQIRHNNHSSQSHHGAVIDNGSGVITATAISY